MNPSYNRKTRLTNYTRRSQRDRSGIRPFDRYFSRLRKRRNDRSEPTTKSNENRRTTKRNPNRHSHRSGHKKKRLLRTRTTVSRTLSSLNNYQELLDGRREPYDFLGRKVCFQRNRFCRAPSFYIGRPQRFAGRRSRKT